MARARCFPVRFAPLRVEREQHLDLLRSGFASVFADLESLGVLHGGTFLGAIPFDEEIAIVVCLATLTAGPALAQPGFATGDISGWRDTLDMLCAARGTAFVVLGSHLVDGSDFQIEYIVHRHDNVRLERIRLFEAVVGIQEHRIFFKGGTSLQTYGTVTIKAASWMSTPT